MRYCRVVAVAILLAVAVAVEVRADLVTNGSFEMGTTLPTGNGLSLPNGSTAMTGWTVFGGQSNDGLGWLPNGNTYGVSTPFGGYFLDLTGYLNQTPYFGVSQNITTVMGQAYVMTFDLGVDQGSGSFSGPIGVIVTAGSSSTTITGYDPTGTGNIWQQFTFDFTATSISTIMLDSRHPGRSIHRRGQRIRQSGGRARALITVPGPLWDRIGRFDLADFEGSGRAGD